MPLWRPDPTFYPSPRMAMQAAPEKLGYVALLDGDRKQRPDALASIDLDPTSSSYGQIVGKVDMPNVGDELHHFGWNACSAHLCPYAPHPHVERRYLLMAAINSSRVYVLDTKDSPRQPKLVRVIEREEIVKRAGYTGPHTVHCGPDGIYVSALGNEAGSGPGGVFRLDHQSFDVLGRWELDRGPQYFAYDFWWHLGHDVMVTSEWGTPEMVKDGVIPEKLLAGQYGNGINIWDLRRRRHLQRLELGKQYQMVLELRPAHDPSRAWGFAGVVISIEDLSSSIWLWFKEGERFQIRKVIDIPAEPASEDQLPPLLKGFKAVAPLLTDINLTLDDRTLYASCWGSGRFLQFDVSDPFNPRQTGELQIGGIVRRAAHPSRPSTPLDGGPQMVELSRDGKRVYFTNSLYTPWDAQFYPDGIKGWMVKADARDGGGLAFDPRFFVGFDSVGLRPHQVHLEGGDASSDSYCYS
jgi:methanethiol oxidase